jgi:hypothetical protein
MSVVPNLFGLLKFSIFFFFLILLYAYFFKVSTLKKPTYMAQRFDRCA